MARHQSLQRSQNSRAALQRERAGLKVTPDSFSLLRALRIKPTKQISTVEGIHVQSAQSVKRTHHEKCIWTFSLIIHLIEKKKKKENCQFELVLKLPSLLFFLNQTDTMQPG